LEALSQHLKSERLRQGLSRGDIARKSDISISLVQALEAGEFSEIGPPFLVYGFLMGYSQALGISLLHLPGKPETPEALEVTIPAAPERETRTPGSARGTKYGWTAAFLVIGIIALGVFFGAGRIFWRTYEQSNHRLSTIAVLEKPEHRPEMPPQATAPQNAAGGKDERSGGNESQTPEDTIRGEPIAEPEADRGSHPGPLTATVAETPVTEEKAISTSPLPPKSDKASGGGSEGPEVRPIAPVKQESPGHHFEIEAIQRSWIWVRIDNQKTESALLQPGERREWEATRKLQAVVGNGGGVQMKWDGKPINLDARPGQVLRFSLPHAGLNSESP